jgi:long-chain fatty acid transport protein
MKLDIRLTGLLAALLIVGTAQGTNGYFTNGVGTKNSALAGAGSADPAEIMIIATNPAGLAFVHDDLEVGLSLFSPIRSYASSASLANGNGGAFTIGPNHITSSNNLFPIPYIAYRHRIDAQNTLGIAFYGRGGMDTRWVGGTATFAPGGPGTPAMQLPGTFGSGTAGVDLMQAFLNLAFAHTMDDRHLAVGLSLIGAAQRFEARGLGAFAGYTEVFAASGGTKMPTALTDNGHEMSYGAGASVGLEWRPTRQWALAAAYTTKMYMSKFSRYADLFAGGGSFDIPASATLGITFKPTSPVAVSFDTQRIWYSGIAAVANPVQNLFNCPTAGAGGTNLQSCLGGSVGAGFGWGNMTVYSLGTRWRLDPDWTLRFGVSHTAQPIPRSEVTLNILAPGVIENHIALGVTHHDASHGQFSVALVYALSHSVTGPNTFDPTQTIRLSMHQYILDFAYAWGH